jgi:hypothetical protein
LQGLHEIIVARPGAGVEGEKGVIKRQARKLEANALVLLVDDFEDDIL